VVQVEPFFGVGPANISPNINVGSFANSVGWQSTGYVYTPTGGGQILLPAFTTGSRIGIMATISGSNRNLKFYLNGKKVGDHNGIPANVKVYPVISFYTQGDSFTILSASSPSETFNEEGDVKISQKIRGRRKKWEF